MMWPAVVPAWHPCAANDADVIARARSVLTMTCRYRHPAYPGPHRHRPRWPRAAPRERRAFAKECPRRRPRCRSPVDRAGTRPPPATGRARSAFIACVPLQVGSQIEAPGQAFGDLVGLDAPDAQSRARVVSTAAAAAPRPASIGVGAGSRPISQPRVDAALPGFGPRRWSGLIARFGVERRHSDRVHARVFPAPSADKQKL